MDFDGTTALWALGTACGIAGLVGLASLVGGILKTRTLPADPFVAGARLEFTGDWCTTHGEHGAGVFTRGQVIKVMGSFAGCVEVRYQSGCYDDGRPAYVSALLIDPDPRQWARASEPWTECTDPRCPYAGLVHVHVREGSAP
jgi:hypothetical protein